MAIFRNPHGVEVSAADAKIGGKLRPGYTESLADGESVHFNMLLMRDAKPKSDQTSIDAELREIIARLAKNEGQTPEEYLAATPMAQIQRLASEAAVKVVEALSGKGIAASLSDSETVAFDKSVSDLNSAYHAKNTFADKGSIARPKVLATNIAPLTQAEDHAYQVGVQGLNDWRKK
jgi:hypothetical protein